MLLSLSLSAKRNRNVFISFWYAPKQFTIHVVFAIGIFVISMCFLWKGGSSLHVFGTMQCGAGGNNRGQWHWWVHLFYRKFEAFFFMTECHLKCRIHLQGFFSSVLEVVTQTMPHGQNHRHRHGGHYHGIDWHGATHPGLECDNCLNIL